MASFLDIYVPALAIILVSMTILWIISVYFKNVSIVDPFWGVIFVIASWFYFTQTHEGNDFRKALLIALVTIWGLRLSLYLFWRNWRQGEDFRYQAFRRKYGPNRYWWVSFFQTFMFQGLLVWIISMPLLGAQIRANDLNIFDLVGLTFWIIGFAFETIGLKVRFMDSFIKKFFRICGVRENTASKEWCHMLLKIQQSKSSQSTHVNVLCGFTLLDIEVLIIYTPVPKRRVLINSIENLYVGNTDCF